MLNGMKQWSRKRNRRNDSWRHHCKGFGEDLEMQVATEREGNLEVGRPPAQDGHSSTYPNVVGRGF